MRSLLASRWFWPGVASPLAVLGVAAAAGGETPGVVAGAGLLLAWALTVPFGRAAALAQREPTPRRHLASAGWALLVVVVLLGGLWLGMSLDHASAGASAVPGR